MSRQRVCPAPCSVTRGKRTSRASRSLRMVRGWRDRSSGSASASSCSVTPRVLSSFCSSSHWRVTWSLRDIDYLHFRACVGTHLLPPVLSATREKSPQRVGAHGCAPLRRTTDRHATTTHAYYHSTAR